jgi:hypothetical protein
MLCANTRSCTGVSPSFRTVRSASGRGSRSSGAGFPLGEVGFEVGFEVGEVGFEAGREVVLEVGFEAGFDPPRDAGCGFCWGSDVVTLAPSALHLLLRPRGRRPEDSSSKLRGGDFALSGLQLS